MKEHWSVTFGALLLYSTLFVISTAIQDPPCPCRINPTSRSVNCSARNLTVIPVCVLQEVNTWHMDLSRNAILSLPVGGFVGLTQLRSLNLSHNHLKRVRNETFKGLTKLEILSLAFNGLDSHGAYEGGVFEPLVKLRTLHIQGNLNTYVSLNYTYPDVALSMAKSVQNLSIDGLPRTRFGSGFKGMESLRILSMNADDGYCHMDKIVPGTFHNLQGIPVEVIEIIDCGINSIPPYTFAGLWNLTTIRSTYARRLCSGSIDNITLGLDTTNIKHIELSDLCHGLSFRFSESTFKGITNTSLETLSLESNRIEYIDPKCIHNLPKSLKYISLRDNFIDDVHFLSEFVVLDNLEVFDASFQNYYHYAETTNSSMHDTVPTANRDRQFLFGKDRHVRPKSNPNDDKIHLPPKMKYMYISHLKLDSYSVIPLMFAKNELKYLDASACQLRGFLGPWIGLRHLEFLNMSYNRFTIVFPTSFSDMLNLTTLLLQHNEMGKEIMNIDTKGDMFSSLTKLKHLDLSNNEIKSLPNLLFRNQRHLEYLSLASNAIVNLTFAVDIMVSLQYLDLSGNQLNAIPNAVLNGLEKISSVSNLSMDLRTNPLFCDCNSQNFVKWLANTKIHLIQGKNLTCRYENGSILSLRDIKTIHGQLEIDCITPIILGVSAGTFVGLILIGAMAAVCYYKRWQLSYLYHAKWKTLNPYHPLLDEDVTLTNDVYISYEADHRLNEATSLDDFVKHQLYPYLESRGLSVNIQDTLKPGRRMYELITDTMRCTRKVIALITDSYLERTNVWNAREFNMAVCEGIFTKRTMIIPVVIGQLTPEVLEQQRDIRSYLNSNRQDILPFPSNGDVNTFLAALYDSLK